MLRANGTANLFLLNPNGIIFGPNASLNIGGSFLGSTAIAINFADGTQFSATAPQTTPLLTVSVPLGLQFGGTAGSILNQSQATNSSSEVVGLQVQPGRTLALFGGDVRLEGGRLQAESGRIELGGLASPGSIGLSMNGSLLSLSFPEGVARADVYLTNNGNNTARVNVAAFNGGSIAINARNIDIAGESLLRGGLETGLGFPGAEAGDIDLSVQGAINVANSGIANIVRTGAVGNGGNINITAGSISVTDSAELSASTSGRGDGGSVNINARDSVFFDRGYAFGDVESGAEGNSDGVNITAGLLSVTNDAQLIASTSGRGDAGSVNINVRDTVSFDVGDAFSRVRSGAVGNGGSVNITTGSLSVTNGAQLQSQTSGRGDAGSVNINVRDTVSFNGGDAFSSVESGAVGNGGDVNITTGSLSVTNSAQLDASTSGQGNGGRVNIHAGNTVSFNGGDAFSRVESGAVGNGGDVNITTGSLSVTNGAQLSASTSGRGNAGIVNINARDTVSFEGVSSDGLLSSAAFSNVRSGAEGNGGSVNITVGSLSVTNGAQLSASTFGQGNGGSVNIRAGSTVFFDRGDAFSQVVTEAVGNGGDINITTGSLAVTNGAQLSASTFGQGDGGSVTILAHDTVSFDEVSSDGLTPVGLSALWKKKP